MIETTTDIGLFNQDGILGYDTRDINDALDKYGTLTFTPVGSALIARITDSTRKSAMKKYSLPKIFQIRLNNARFKDILCKTPGIRKYLAKQRTNPWLWVLAGDPQSTPDFELINGQTLVTRVYFDETSLEVALRTPEDFYNANLVLVRLLTGDKHYKLLKKTRSGKYFEPKKLKDYEAAIIKELDGLEDINFCKVTETDNIFNVKFFGA